MALPPENPAQTQPIQDVRRRALRQRCLAARDAMPDSVRATASRQLEAHLWAGLDDRLPGCLAFCWPVRGEFDLLPLIHRLHERGWRLAIPVVTAPAAPMEFRPWSPTSAMGSDRHGIPIPLDGHRVKVDLLLVPLVAFDGAGYRLGYGGGYFDRTLAALLPRPETVGIGFELGRVASIDPQPHDIPLNHLVTENGWQTVGCANIPNH